MIGWIDASAGASGDMLLGALVGAGVPLSVMQDAVDAVAPEPVTLRVEEVTRGGFAATRVHVETAESTTLRTWAEIRAMDLGDRARPTFGRLASAEAAVHGKSIDDVHFHEVGALDAIADVVGVCAGLDHLGLDALYASPVAVGSGYVNASHGRLPVPPPAVTSLLRGVPSYAGPAGTESCTPTGAALLRANVQNWGPQPAMTVQLIGVGAGARDPKSYANVVRLLVGEGAKLPGSALLLETNVDDIDPRLWPSVLQALFDAGASDAWLTPILMKKGRPAHTLSVLVVDDDADDVRRAVFTHTTSLGVRETPVGKTALERTIATVEVDGHTIDVKIGWLDGGAVNLQPEYEHVAAAARALGRPVKDVLQQAVAEARRTAP